MATNVFKLLIKIGLSIFNFFMLYNRLFNTFLQIISTSKLTVLKNERQQL